MKDFPIGSAWNAENKNGFARIKVVNKDGAYGDWYWSWRNVDGSGYGGDYVESYKSARAKCVARLGKLRFIRV